MSGLVIHALQVGGGILALSGLPGQGGDYAADMEHLGNWKPALVITLTTRAELVDAAAEGFGAAMQDRGTRWAHLPVRDMAAPDDAFEARWPEVARAALAALAGGGRVLVHCRGGCGRSGMVALRLMVEAGEDADEALARLRHVRPCAIETEAQMAWARAAEKPPAVFVRSRD